MPAVWHAMLAALLVAEAPALPDLPGRLIVCRDEALTPEDIQAIDSPAELALVLGISPQAAWKRLRLRKATHDPAR